MLEVLKLVGAQVVVAAVALCVLLVIVHVVAPKSNVGFVLLTLSLTATVIVAAIWGIFVHPWWLYALLWAVGIVALLVLGLALFNLLEPEASAKIGPAGTGALLPFLVMFVAFPSGGLLQWLIGLIRR